MSWIETARVFCFINFPAESRMISFPSYGTHLDEYNATITQHINWQTISIVGYHSSHPYLR